MYKKQFLYDNILTKEGTKIKIKIYLYYTERKVQKSV
jgi:hypothetical protein